MPIDLTPQECRFLELYVWSDDPIGLFVETFDPERRLSLDDAAEALAEYLSREPVRQELYAQERIKQIRDEGWLAVWADLDAVRDRALATPETLCEATSVAIVKAQLLGFYPIGPAAQTHQAETRAYEPAVFMLPGSDTVH